MEGKYDVVLLPPRAGMTELSSSSSSDVRLPSSVLSSVWDWNSKIEQGEGIVLLLQLLVADAAAVRVLAARSGSNLPPRRRRFVAKQSTAVALPYTWNPTAAAVYSSSPGSIRTVCAAVLIMESRTPRLDPSPVKISSLFPR